ncbi:MAG TPA: DNA-3-methyladenine glycosylase [Bacillales bacterium]|nr:DNA-3-methyladenine glycosylase [Bacillales bacterium]
MQTETFLFKPKWPYNLNLSLQRLKRNPIYTFGEEGVRRTLHIGGSLYLIKIYFQEPGRTEVKVEGVCLEGTMEPERVRGVLERMLSVHQDLHEVYRYMNGMPKLMHLTREFEGLHIFREPDLFECMVKLIIGQQITTSFATDLTRNLIEAVAKTVFCGEREYYIFPNPDQVAKLQIDDLARKKFNRRKAEYIVDFAKQIDEGSIDLFRFHDMADSDVMRDLIKIRGIGPWTATCFMIFGLGRENLVPASDIGIQKAVQKVYGQSKRPTKDELLQLAEEWNPIASYVSRYLWETLRA